MIAASQFIPTATQRKSSVWLVLVIAVSLLIAFGIVLVYDASFPKSLQVGTDPRMFGRKQAIGLFVGLVLAIAAFNFSHLRLKRYAGLIMMSGFVLLALVFVHGIGVHHLNATRWIHFGPMTIEPSEIAKVTLILFIASILARPDSKINEVGAGLIATLVVTGAYLVLIQKQPDLGTSIVILGTVGVMLLVAGARPKHLAIALGIAVVLFFAKGGLKKGQILRLTTYVSQGEDSEGAGYQTFQSLRAVGSGEATGLGLGKGRQKYYLPEANSDFIYATISEELGFLGSSLTLLLYCVIAAAGIFIARNAADSYSSLLAIGLTAQLTIQAMTNIAVVTVMIPATGVPLPFVSCGSTSLVMSLVSVAMLLSIARGGSVAVRQGASNQRLANP